MNRPDEFALAESESMFDPAPPMVALIGIDFTFRFVNAIGAEGWGGDADQIVGRDIKDVLIPSNHAALIPLLESTLNGHQASAEIPWSMAAERLPRLKQVTVVGSIDSAGEIDGCHVIIVDVTERRQRHRNLEFLTSLQAGFNALDPNAPWLNHAIVRTREFLNLSQLCLFESHCDTGVLRLTEQVGPPLGNELPLSDLLSQDQRDQLLGGFQVLVDDPAAAATEKETANTESHSQAATRRELLGPAVFTPHVDDERLKFVLLASRDLPQDWTASELDLLQQVSTRLCIRLERRRAELDLARNQRRLELALQAGGMAAWQWSEQQSVWEPQLYDLLGIDPAREPSSDLFLQRVHPDDRQHLSELWQQVLEGHSHYKTEFRVVDPDGTVRWLAGVGRVMDGGNSEGRLIHGLNWDITEQKESSVRISASEERLRLALSAAELRLWQWDILADRFYWADKNSHQDNNQTFGSMGSLEEFLQFIHSDDREVVGARLRDCLNSGRPYRCEYRVMDSVGGIRWVLSLGHLSLKDDNSPAQMVGIELDITSEKQSQRSLEIAVRDFQDTNTKLRGLIDSGVVFSCILDLDGQISEANDVSTIHCGYDRQSVIGKEFWNGPWWECYPSSREKIVESFGQTLRGEVARIELKYRTGDEQRRVVDLSLSAARDADGTVVYVVANGIDITQRKRSEQAIRLSEQRLRGAAEAAGFGMLHADLRNRRVTYSREMKRIIGHPEDHDFGLVPGKTPDFVYPPDVETWRDHWRKCLQSRNRTVPPLIHRIVRPDGEVRWVRLQTKTLFARDKSGQRRATQVIGTCLDITDQRRFEQSLDEARRQAEAANDSKSAFLANMSHEIRTPMAAILGYIDLVAESLVDDPVALGHIETVRHNGDFLLSIINDILDLSKIEAGKMDFATEQFAPNRLVEDVRSIMQVRAKECNLDLQVEYVGKIPQWIHSDPKRLKQILVNLVGNAIKFTDQGKVILKVAFNPSGSGKMIFEVIDTGIGMTPKQQERLFKPFSQADQSVTRQFGGTGLGLAISQRLAEMLGGKIEVDSESGRGSCFKVTIDPGDIQDAKMIVSTGLEENPEVDPEPLVQKLSCSVLVVDDRQELRFLSNRLLSRLGATVDEAEDGQEAVEMVQQMLRDDRPVDVILLDMQMPRLDGYRTAEQLRRLGFKGTIIALTADAMQGDMKRCIACGCNHYLSKPIDSQRMLRLVAEVTGQ